MLALFVISHVFQAIKSPNANIFDAVSCTLVSSTTLFFYCYYGKMASDSLSEMTESFYECNWHEFHLKYVKYFIIAIANAQKTMHFHGAHFVNLHLETFKNVSILHTICSITVIRNAFFVD